MSNSSSQLYEELNKAWKSTCRIVLGDDIGELKDYEYWLKEYAVRIGKRKSCVSGKDVSLIFNDYCQYAQVVSADEVNETGVALNIDQIKDVDSIIEAIGENWRYTGNRILGNSRYIEGSEGVIDSSYVLDSVDVQQSSHVYASTLINGASKNFFGVLRSSGGEFAIKSVRFGRLNRSFESYLLNDSSDVYYCAHTIYCHEMLFSFNQRNKQYCIGNLQLTKDRYYELKKKLLCEIREELKKNKRIPGLFETIPNKEETVPDISLQSDQLETNFEIIDKGFNTTCRTVLKREVGGLKELEPWLSKHLGGLKELNTSFGSKTYILDDSYFSIYSKFPDKKAVTLAEAEALEKLKLDEKEIDSLSKIRENLGKIGYITDEFYSGQNSNAIKTLAVFDAVNIYNTHAAGDSSEHAAVCSTVVNSKYVYGSRIAGSQFCINCYNCLKLNRCFEMDGCSNCSDSYFCHNCEGLSEAMFCWNIKAKRYAIGNSQLAPDQYRKIKDALVGQMAEEIITNKSLKYDIFNIGCGKL